MGDRGALLAVPALEIRHPVAELVAMVADDSARDATTGLHESGGDVPGADHRR